MPRYINFKEIEKWLKNGTTTPKLQIKVSAVL